MHVKFSALVADQLKLQVRRLAFLKRFFKCLVQTQITNDLAQPPSVESKSMAAKDVFRCVVRGRDPRVGADHDNTLSRSVYNPLEKFCRREGGRSRLVRCCQTLRSQ